MRFLVEGYLDLALFSLMNVSKLDWETKFTGVKVCNFVAIILVILTCLMPIFFLIFFLVKKKDWSSDAFKAKYGTLLEELNNQGNWIIVMLPVGHLVRRECLCLILVYWQEFLWGQVAVMLQTTIFMIIYI